MSKPHYAENIYLNSTIVNLGFINIKKEKVCMVFSR